MFTGLESPTHWLILGIVALLVFGPKRLPELGRSLGTGLRGFRDGLSGGSTEAPAAAPDDEREPQLDERAVAAPVDAPDPHPGEHAGAAPVDAPDPHPGERPGAIQTSEPV
jgi:sec-independent protein translocase protein TatA